MRSSRQTGLTPYAVIGEHYFPDGSRATWTLCRRKRFADAMAYAHRLTYSWLRLTGAAGAVLQWYVLDERDGTEHRKLTREGPQWTTARSTRAQRFVSP